MLKEHPLRERPLSSEFVMQEMLRRREFLQDPNAIIDLYSQYSIKLQKLPYGVNIEKKICDQLQGLIPNAKLIVFNEYCPETKLLVVKAAAGNSDELARIGQMVSKPMSDLNTHITDAMLEDMLNNPVIISDSFHRITYGTTPQFVSDAVQKFLGAKKMVGMSFDVDGKLYGTILIALDKDPSKLQMKILKNYTAVASVSLGRQKAEEALRYLSNHDVQTGLFNRNYYQAEIERLNVDRKLPISIFMTDLDDFKKINDKFGHNVGDLFIVEAAKILKEVFREEDIIVRWGGDEFLIVLPETSGKNLEKIKNRIKEKRKEVEVIVNGVPVRVPFDLSIGYATKTKVDQNIEEIIEEADSRMYKDKAKKK